MKATLAGTFQSSSIWLRLGILGIAVLMPAFMHVVPQIDGVSWGARFLPIFYAPMVALFAFGLPAAVGVGAAMPGIYCLVTGSPAGAVVPILSLELVAFAALLRVIEGCRLPGVFAPALCYLAAKLISALVLVMTAGSVSGQQSVLAFFSASALNAIPGIVALCVVFWGLQRAFGCSRV